MEGEASKRVHRKAQAGSKYKKKVENEKKKAGLDNHRHNPKAFTHSGGTVSTHRKVQRSAEIEQKRAKREVIDKTPDIPPPYIVAVQGPPGVGKSTLIKSLVKHYSKHNISDVNGPITLVSGRNRRITFIECPNNMQQMIDVAKVADLVLLLADGSHGFEMETFEFLNIMQTHGFPRVMGILTHLDGFKEGKLLRKQKKKLKNRFWTEIYDGAKLFYLSGMQYGRYNKTEIKNLTRFLAVQKFQPLSFRSAHPYVLALRMEDQTPPEAEPNAPRTINLYGYVKGARMREGQMVHIPGAGDFPIRAIDDFNDPCPPPQASVAPEKRKKANETGSRLLRSLKDNQRGIYAPGCDVGNVQLDADAMYIHIPEHQIGFTRADRLQLQGGGTLDSRGKTGLRKEQQEMTGTKRKRAEVGDEEDEDLGMPGVADGSDDDEAEDSGRRMTAIPDAVKMVHALQDAKGALAKARAGNLTLLPGGAVVSEGADVFDGRDNMEGFYTDDEEEDEEQDSDDEIEGDVDSEGGSAVPWKKRGAASAEEAADSLDEDSDEEMQEDAEDDSDDEDDDEDDEQEEGDDEEGQYELESDVDVDDEEEEEDEESDEEDAIARFMSGGKVDPNAPAARVEATHLSLTKSSDLVYGKLRWKSDDKAAAAAETFKTASSEKLTLFDEDDEEDEESRDARQMGLESGQTATGLMGQVPVGHAAVNGLDCSKLPPAAFLDSPLPAARLKHLGVAGVAWMLSKKWDEERFEALKKKQFITGGWDGEEEQEEKPAKTDDDEEEGDEDAEDAEAEQLASQLGWRRGQKDVKPATDEDGEKLYYDEEGNLLEGVLAHAAKLKEEAAQRKATLEDLASLNDLGSKAIGSFVRIVVANVPAAWVKSYTMKRPVIVGGLLPGESKLGMMQAKVRRHRWSPRVLKNQDPLLFSIGWRRFQSVPTYCLEDRNQARIRMLKYTPEHLHCLATLYGPLHPPNTGLLAVRQWGSGVTNFRVSLTGSVIASAANFTVVKKLKLVGEPIKILKHTAFIKGLFNSDLEVAKCIGSRIETVSGIRGQIKKADGTAGHFRATFEDKILLSDLVVMKAWTAVEPKQFYNPVLDVDGWRRVRTIAELRRALREPAPFKHDSEYQAKPERRERKFGATKIPKRIMDSLPFDSRPKNEAKKKFTSKEKFEMEQETKATSSAYEQRVNSLMNKLETVRADRERIYKKKLEERLAKKAKIEEREEAKREVKRKALKKEHYKKEGKVQEAKRRKLRLNDD